MASTVCMMCFLSLSFDCQKGVSVQVQHSPCKVFLSSRANCNAVSWALVEASLNAARKWRRGFTLQDTTPRASLQFSKWHGVEQPFSIHDSFWELLTLPVFKSQIHFELQFRKWSPLHFPHIEPLLVNILACLDVSRLAKRGWVAAYQKWMDVVETDPFW